MGWEIHWETCLLVFIVFFVHSTMKKVEEILEVVNRIELELDNKADKREPFGWRIEDDD